MAKADPSVNDLSPLPLDFSADRISPQAQRSLVERLFRDCEWIVASLSRIRLTGLLEARFSGARLSYATESSTFGWFADPFPFEMNGERYFLCEEWNRLRWRGSIAAFRFTESGGTEYLGTAIEDDDHRAYPYIVTWKEDVYCIPDASATGHVELLRMVDDEARSWKRVGILVEQAVVDPSLFRLDGRWWMLGTLRSSGTEDRLHAWWAPELVGPWQRHEENPVVVRPGRVRSAGTIVEVEGELYRPSQDCRRVYGHRIIWNRIESLSRTAYREREVSSVGTDTIGLPCERIHTVGISDRQILVDFGKEVTSALRAIGLLGYKGRSLLSR